MGTSDIATNHTPSARTAIALIGMAGVGKSTVGHVLAERMGLPFIDTDEVIESMQGRSLKGIIEAEGLDAFRRIENESVCSLKPQRAIIATGGSVVYGQAAMEHLRSFCVVVWLQNEADRIKTQLGDRTQRGLASAAEKTLDEVMAEREPLYANNADMKIHCGARSAERIAEEIGSKLAEHGWSEAY